MKYQDFINESKSDEYKTKTTKEDVTTSNTFKKWFGKSKIVDKNGSALKVYHATNKKFDEFKFKGEKLTSLGLGFYFTPSLKKSKQYGDIVMEVYLHAENILNWNELTDKDRKTIIDHLNKLKIDADDIAGFGSVKSKKFHKDELEDSKKFFAEMKAKTKSYTHDRAKAKVSKSGEYFIVSWMESGFEGASDENLLALIQRYDNDFAERVGYDGVWYHDEIVVFKSNQIKSVDNTGTFDPNSNNIYK